MPSNQLKMDFVKFVAIMSFICNFWKHDIFVGPTLLFHYFVSILDQYRVAILKTKIRRNFIIDMHTTYFPLCIAYSNLFKSYHCLRIVIYYNVAINLLWLIKMLQVWNLISRRTTHMAVNVFECFYLFYFLCMSTISWKKWYLI